MTPSGLLRAVRRAALAALVSGACLGLGGCAGPEAAGGAGSSLVGVIESVDAGGLAAWVQIVGGIDVEQSGGRVRVELDDAALLRGVQPGASVRLRFVQSGGSYVLTGMEVLR